jgi:GTPase SAR1 family protein
MQINPTAKQVIQFINQTHQHVFLTGNAGTGKTTLVNYIVQNTFKKHVVVAPTGIAALNAKGVTIHSMFQLPFACFLPDKNPPRHFLSSTKIETQNTLGKLFKMNATKKLVIQELELLIIDEVSMLRPDVLDAMDFMLQKVRRNTLPFGGVQVLFVGDLMQLPPVINQEEWQVLKTFYNGKFFFHARVFQKTQAQYIELDTIYRQQDFLFIDMLNQLRNNRLEDKYKQILNEKLQPNFDVFHNVGYITLTTHNKRADHINGNALQQLEKKPYTYSAEIIGDFSPHIFPLEEKLVLKEGAQVMFVKNDPNPEKQYFNGKMGVIKGLSSNEIFVYFPDENKTIEVDRYEWENIKYTLNETTKEIEEEKIGTFVQYPLKLAWAITVHKSQGLTFQKAVLDVNEVFVSGQMYVAFSRLTSLDGLVLLSPFRVQNFDAHDDVLVYATNKLPFEENEKTLNQEKELFAKNYILNAYNWSKMKAFWHNHLNTYQEEALKSYKSNSKGEITKLYTDFLTLNEATHKFVNQLLKVFNHSPVDFKFIHQRTQDALGYFLPLLRAIQLKMKIKLIEAQKQKKAKQYHTELLDLDYHFLGVIEQLFKVIPFVACLSQNKEIDKNQLQSLAFYDYHSQLKADAIVAFREQNQVLVEESTDESLYLIEKKLKPKKSKIEKGATFEETLGLLNQGLSKHDVAEKRKLSVTTIEGHIAKLVGQKKINIEDFLSMAKIELLKELFKKYDDNLSLSAIKEQVGDSFTWFELKIAQAAFVKNDS